MQHTQLIKKARDQKLFDEMLDFAVIRVRNIKDPIYLQQIAYLKNLPAGSDMTQMIIDGSKQTSTIYELGKWFNDFAEDARPDLKERFQELIHSEQINLLMKKIISSYNESIDSKKSEEYMMGIFVLTLNPREIKRENLEQLFSCLYLYYNKTKIKEDIEKLSIAKEDSKLTSGLGLCSKRAKNSQILKNTFRKTLKEIITDVISSDRRTYVQENDELSTGRRVSFAVDRESFDTNSRPIL